MDIQNNNVPIKPVLKKTKAVLSKTLQMVLGISGLIIVLCIIAGGALLASHTWNPGWNPFKQPTHTDQVIKQKIMDKIKK